jgi:Cd2+/Zn2+-exporting ATPase
MAHANSAPSADPAKPGWLHILLTDRQMMLVAVAGVLLLAGWLVGLNDGPWWLRVLLLVSSAICSSTETSQTAFHSLRARKLDVDVLMFAAAIGAAWIGHYEEAALLLFLFGTGAAGEHLAMTRARNAISELTKLTPATACKLDLSNAETTVPVEQLAVDDRIVIRPFDRLPADAMILTGTSTADESALTGESIPVEKSAGATVFAGTMNGHGKLVCRVLRLANDTTLARIVRLVEEAQQAKSSTQRLTDKIEAYYVPAVFVATLFLIVLPPWWLKVEWGVSFYRAMAFLTAASPCALAIGTPAAVLCGIGRAARMGIIIKGGLHLEQLARVKAVAFDKTGTLTTGKLSVTRVIVAADAGREADEVLALAAAIESHATHPIAYAISARARELSLAVPETTDVSQVAGTGVTGRIGQVEVSAGKLTDQDRSELTGTPAEGELNQVLDAGNAIVVVRRGGKLFGLVALADTPRASSKQTIDGLRAMGIGPSVILTGDHAAAAEHVGRLVGVDEIRAGLLPAQKLEILHELEGRYGSIAMVGDGVNDAPALAAATVGIAVGGGSDVALETADVVLVGGDIARLPAAIALARGARSIINQNLVIALGVIAVVAPLAATGFAKLGVAVLLHEGSTVVVVLNSLRLLRWKPTVKTGSQP